MREKIVDLLEKIDLALAESEGVLDPDLLEQVNTLRDEIRTRLAYPDDVLIVGLVGGTGSGKSSLINAVAGSEIAVTGSIRPTTGEPLALVPPRSFDALSGFFDELGVRRRVPGPEGSAICLIDLPDMDSVDISHAQTVEELLPRLDAVAWIVDPEKYRDAIIHRQIAALSDYQSQFVFVLNQADRLPQHDRSLVADDFTTALQSDGIGDPLVYLTASDPMSGPPIGVDDLVTGVVERFQERSGVYSKLIRDVAAAATRLTGLAGGAAGLDFERRWAEAKSSVSAHLDARQMSEAAHEVAELLQTLAGETGDLTGEELEHLADEVHDIVEAGAVSEDVLGELEAKIAEPARRVLRMRARCHAAITELALAAADSVSR